jgi:hypothetical protein
LALHCVCFKAEQFVTAVNAPAFLMMHESIQWIAEAFFGGMAGDMYNGADVVR